MFDSPRVMNVLYVCILQLSMLNICSILYLCVLYIAYCIIYFHLHTALKALLILHAVEQEREGWRYQHMKVLGVQKKRSTKKVGSLKKVNVF